jgi:hypothetical protein
MFTTGLLRTATWGIEQSGMLSDFTPGSAPTFFLAYSHPSVANHTWAWSSDARTRALSLDLPRAHSGLTTSVIEPGGWPIRSR